jgi:transposase
MNDADLTREQLNTMPHDLVVTLFLAMQSSLNELKKTVQILSEQVSVMNSRQYGRKTEQVSDLQIELELGFNDTEVTADETVPEPELEEAAPKKKRPAGKREEDLKKITEHKEIEIGISEEELDEKFGKGNWKKLPPQIITKLEHVPASFIAVTYKIGVYAAKDNQTIIRAEKPDELWTNSIATPSLVSSIIFGKYVNAVPLYRQEQVYKENNINISRATMANWMLMTYEKYLKYYYEALHRKLIKQKYLHADETPLLVSKDGRKTGSKSYMWVYTTVDMDGVPKIALYNYRMTRSSEHPREFLRGFKGTVMTDAFESYHKLEKEDPESFKVAGCWVHAKRKYTDIIKAEDKKVKAYYAEQAVKKITRIFHENGKLDQLSPEERLKWRQEKVKPLVDEYFEWVRKYHPYVDAQSQTGKAFAYSLNQEKYLRVFLEDPYVDMDNNKAERTIRPFTVGRKNWVMIDTIRGAEASAGLYSLAETAKANNLKTYDYFCYLLTELPKYIHDFETEIPESLFPWSEDFPKELFR